MSSNRSKVALLLVFLGVSSAGAQVRLLNVGTARATGRAAQAAPASVPGIPSWMASVPVRSTFETVLFALRYPEMAARIESSGLVPGLTGPCTPQGIARLADGRVALSYHVEHPKAEGPAGSVLVLVDATGSVQAVRELTDTAGVPLTLHVGGIAAAGNYLWTGGSGRILRFPLPTGSDRFLRADASYELDATVSWVAAYANTLWVGDFYRDGEKPAGRGWAAGYTLDGPGAKLLAWQTYSRDGRRVLRPDAVIYLPTQVQGFAVTLDRVLLSRSHGSRDGDLDLYPSPLNTVPRRVSLPDGQSTIGWSLGEMEKRIPVPSGAEDLEWVPPYLLMNFESGCQAYRDAWRGRGAMVEDRFFLLKLP